MKLNIQEIDNELERISEEQSRLFGRERELDEEKRKLLAKDICDNKHLNVCIWKVKERYGSGFILRPETTSIIELDDIQTKLRLYPHGSFKLDENVELCGDDGDLYITVSDTKAGIEFIRSQDMKIVIDKSVTENIESMEREIAELKELIHQFDGMCQMWRV